MGTYKVIQDIEAEDKLLGPLTLKQFIFAGIAAGSAYLSFIFLTRGAPFVLLFTLPPMFFFGFLAWPWSKEQPTEIWLLAKLRFFIKPKRRIWDQTGLKELVTITAPKQQEKTYTNGLSEGEVKSRLEALANTLDSRGWAVKNVSVNLFSQPQYTGAAAASDRLVDLDALPKEVTNADVTLSDDMLDAENNPVAQKLDRMIQSSTASHHQQLVQQIQSQATGAGNTGQPADYWFMSQGTNNPPSGQAMFDGSATVLPGSDDDNTASIGPAEQALLAKLHTQPKHAPGYGHMRVIDPAGTKPKSAAKNTVAAKDHKATHKQINPAIIELANNDDLNVATIARQAHKQTQGDLSDGEVVIPLR